MYDSYQKCLSTHAFPHLSALTSPHLRRDKFWRAQAILANALSDDITNSNGTDWVVCVTCHQLNHDSELICVMEQRKSIWKFDSHVDWNGTLTVHRPAT